MDNNSRFENQPSLSIQEILPSLQSLMKIPSEPKKILVVDDDRGSVNQILEILNAWKNIETSFAFPNQWSLASLEFTQPPDLYFLLNPTIKKVDPVDIKKVDIILIDEDFNDSKLNGSVMFDSFSTIEGFKANFISITSGRKPTWAQNHFSQKLGIKNIPIARDFVNCVNKAID